MKTRVDARLLEEARRFELRLGCEDCAIFARSAAVARTATRTASSEAWRARPSSSSAKSSSWSEHADRLQAVEVSSVATINELSNGVPALASRT